MIRSILAAACWLAVPRGDAAPADTADQAPPKTAKDLIRKQEPPRVIPEVYAKATPENTRIVINLATQRAYLMIGAEVCIDTPVSSGKGTAPTQAGTFTVLEKIKSHQSATYGNFVDKKKRVVRSGVSMKLDAAPAGTRYVSLPMPFFCRFTDMGFGIYAGMLPGYPAAHGSVRVPEDVARFIYEKVRVGTPLEIRAE
jgi:lipoprotein-anchoring transpeptidase ErfK/SrfK